MPGAGASGCAPASVLGALPVSRESSARSWAFREHVSDPEQHKLVLFVYLEPQSRYHSNTLGPKVSAFVYFRLPSRDHLYTVGPNVGSFDILQAA